MGSRKKRHQAALETLILIGGVVILAAASYFIMKGFLGTSRESTNATATKVYLRYAVENFNLNRRSVGFLAHSNVSDTLAPIYSLPDEVGAVPYEYGEAILYHGTVDVWVQGTGSKVASCRFAIDDCAQQDADNIATQCHDQFAHAAPNDLSYDSENELVLIQLYTDQGGNHTISLNCSDEASNSIKVVKEVTFTPHVKPNMKMVLAAIKNSPGATPTLGSFIWNGYKWINNQNITNGTYDVENTMGLAWSHENAVTCWYEKNHEGIPPGDFTIRWSKWDGGTWSSPQDIMITNGTYEVTRNCGWSEAGTGVCVWGQHIGDKPLNYVYWSGSGFGEVGNVTTYFGGTFLGASIDYMTNTEAMLVYYTTGRDYLNYSIWDGSSWGAQQQLAPQDWDNLHSSGAIGFLDQDTGLYMVIANYSNERHVVYSEWDGSSWSPLANLTASHPAEPQSVSMAEDENGNIVILYVEGTSFPVTVKYLTWNETGFSQIRTFSQPVYATLAVAVLFEVGDDVSLMPVTTPDMARIYAELFNWNPETKSFVRALIPHFFSYLT